MENKIEEQTSKPKKKFYDKYGVWLMVIGLVVTMYILKYVLEFIEK